MSPHLQSRPRPRGLPAPWPLALALIAATALPPAAVRAGAPALDTLAVLDGQAYTDWFGVSVAPAGDVNGDGHEDVIVGAYAQDATGTDAGRAYVYYGGPLLDAVPDLILTGTSFYDYFGTSVSGAGDMNGDGYDDVIVGSPGDDVGFPDGLTNNGSAFVYFGGPAPDAVADLVLVGAAAGDYLGISVAGAGDVNGDGFGDVIAGAWYHDGVAPNSGSAYVYFGGPVPDVIPDLTLMGRAEEDNFGVAVSAVGDANGDGFADVGAGAWFSDEAGADAGSVHIFFGGPGADSLPDRVLLGPAAGENFGAALAAGDMNGDGTSDLAVGATFGGPKAAGRAYVFFGGPGADSVADLSLDGEGPGDQFGAGLASAGDVDGDGDAELVVGARFNDGAFTNAGRAYLFFGGSDMDAAADLDISGAAQFDNLGYAAGGGADLNGDGRADFLVGAPFGGSAVGRVYVLAVDGVTPVLAPRFVARGEGLGIRIEWTVRGDETFEHAALERAPATTGPWRELARTRAGSGWSDGLLDGEVEPGRVYHYRIVVGIDGREVVFGPIAAQASTAPDLALVVAPHPVLGRAWIDYTVPRAAEVRLRLLDVQGRERARIAEGPHAPGRHRAAWPAGLEPGLYLLSLSGGSTVISRPVVVIR